MTDADRTLDAYAGQYDREAFKRTLRRRYVYQRESIEAIAATLPPAATTIGRWIREWGWTRSREQYNWDRVERVVREHYETGGSLRAASEHVAPSYDSVWDHAREWAWYETEPTLAAQLAQADSDEVTAP